MEVKKYIKSIINWIRLIRLNVVIWCLNRLLLNRRIKISKQRNKIIKIRLKLFLQRYDRLMDGLVSIM